MARITMKFGGTSVGNAEALRHAATIVRQTVDDGHQVIVVTSAMGGVTNLLIEGARTASEGDGARHTAIAQMLRAKHQAVIDELVTDAHERQSLSDMINGQIDQFSTFCTGMFVLREASDKAMAAVSGLGERMCAPLLAALLRQEGLASQPLDACALLITDDEYLNANVLQAESEPRVRQGVLPLLERKIVPVLTGFVGATRQGVVTTLGRSGSDYSAAIFGAYLQSDEVWIWTDVDGVLTADPRMVDQARTIPVISYAEVGEMAYFGAKVLHSKTVQPLVERNIPLRVKNTFNPTLPGTLITNEANATPGTVKAVTAIRDVSLITVAGRGMIGVPGIAARTFMAVAKQHANVLMITQSSSEQSICFVVPEAKSRAVVKAIEDELSYEFGRQDIDRAWADDDVVIITVVGAGMRRQSGVAARVFGALGEREVNIIAIAQGTSDHCLSMVVQANDTEAAVTQIHKLVVLNGRGQPAAPPVASANGQSAAQPAAERNISHESTA
ncbi:MAG: aspartate kinase [Chloroflexi bacterium]|nr:aspartate kinase [Chloroflexota bacterium]